MKAEEMLRGLFQSEGYDPDAAIKLAYGVRWNVENAESLIKFINEGLARQGRPNDPAEAHARRDNFLIDVHAFLSNWDLMRDTEETLMYEDGESPVD